MTQMLLSRFISVLSALGYGLGLFFFYDSLHNFDLTGKLVDLSHPLLTLPLLTIAGLVAVTILVVFVEYIWWKFFLNEYNNKENTYV